MTALKRKIAHTVNVKMVVAVPVVIHKASTGSTIFNFSLRRRPTSFTKDGNYSSLYSTRSDYE
jgi:hypothetical protein